MGRDSYGEILSADWKGGERRGELRQVSLASAKWGLKWKIRAGNWVLGHTSLSYWKPVSNICTLHLCACTNTRAENLCGSHLFGYEWISRLFPPKIPVSVNEGGKRWTWPKGNSQRCFADTKVVVSVKSTITPGQVPAEFPKKVWGGRACSGKAPLEGILKN